MKLTEIDIPDDLYDVIKEDADRCEMPMNDMFEFYLQNGLTHLLDCDWEKDFDDDNEDIDENIIGVVAFIEDFSDTFVPVGSCGGHEYPSDESQAPWNEWYVNFVIKDPETHEVIDNLKDIKRLSLFLTEIEFEPNVWIRLECCMSIMGDFYYTLRGHNFDPEDGDYFPCICNDCREERKSEQSKFIDTNADL
jgi:hypothetical protein